MAATKDEILQILDDESIDDRLCIACDWLEEVTGDPVEESSYSEESVREAVEAEDVSLLDRI